MPHGEPITDAELDIMKALWKNGASDSPAIFAAMEKGGHKNIRTLKTLLSRLVKKGAVRYEEITSRRYLYTPVITEEEYLRSKRRGLIDRMFDGSAKNMLFNLVKEEHVAREDLVQLIQELDEAE
jgi:BlaI family penicillinase repressor